MSDLLVLCYHGISEDWRSELTVSPRSLERQLTTLVGRGYRGVRFGEAATSSTAGKRLAVTFDDAYRSVLELAFPILDRLELLGTVFVATRFAAGGQTACWSGMEPYLAHADELEVMSWRELALLQDRGWEIGSHTRMHPRLTDLGQVELLEELTASRQECEDRLGTPCLSLAYPYGDTNARVVRGAAEAGYRAAAGLPQRSFHAATALNWPRIGIYERDARWRFELKTSPALRQLRAGASRTPGPEPAVFVAPPHDQDARAGARVAVIVPCFNDGELVTEAVRSIQEAEPVEIVVIDDASSESVTLRTLEGLREAGIKVIRHDRNLGLPAARMSGLQGTHAPYVFPLDADDLAVPGALGAMADVLDGNGRAAACFGDYAEFGTRERVRRVPARLDPYRIAYRNDYPVSSLFRRSALESAGGWQPVAGGVGYEDWNLWMSLAELGAVGVHWGQGAAVRRRLHGPRMLTDAARLHIGLYAALRRLHPQLFAELRSHRRRSDLSLLRRWLYPLVFGWRPPLSVRTRMENLRASLRTARTGRDLKRASSQRSN